MALINCEECGRQFSDKASACPGCGCPPPGAHAERPQGAPPPIPSFTPRGVSPRLSPIPQAPLQGNAPPQELPAKPTSIWKRNVGGPVAFLFLMLLVLGGFLLWRNLAQRSSAPGSPGSPGSVYSSGSTYSRSNQKMIDKFVTLKEGHNLTFRLPPGTYSVRVTASNKGIKARWIGASCYTSPREEKVYQTTCTLPDEAQFIVENPTKIGLGPSEQVSISAVMIQ